MKHLGTSALALILASGAAFAQTQVQDDSGEIIVQEQNTMQGGTTAQNERTMQNDTETVVVQEGESAQRDVDAVVVQEGGNQPGMNERAYTSDDMYNQRENLIRVSDITDSPIYSTADAEATNANWDDTRQWTQIGADWNQIGEIDDIVLSTNGEMTGIVAEVGGFLGIGQKHVVLAINDVNLVPTEDGRYAYVTRYSEDQLTDMQGLDEGFWN